MTLVIFVKDIMGAYSHLHMLWRCLRFKNYIPFVGTYNCHKKQKNWEGAIAQ